MINIDINKGDYILVGRFKNKRIEVKEFGLDEHGLPTINGRGILKIRIEKLMKTKKKPVNESSDKWDQGIQNTKLFDVTNEVGAWSQTGKQFLQGCKHCNSVVKLDNMHKERQMIGNVYQSLCTCSKCKRPVVFDEHKYKLYEYYLKTILKEIVKKQIKESAMSLNDLEDYFYENEDTIRDNMETYGFELRDISKIRNYIDFASVLGVDSRDVKDVDLGEYTSMLAGFLNHEQRESKQLKEEIDYEEDEITPHQLVKDKEYVWIMGAAPLLVTFTGRGKKAMTYNFAFVDKPAVNHDLTRRFVMKYIKYKEGESANQMESKQFKLAEVAKKILKA